MTRRRTLLRSLAAAGGLGLAGCVSDPGQRAEPGPETDRPTTTETATSSVTEVQADDATTATADGDSNPADTGASEPVRGGAERITTDRTITDADLEYLEAEHAVRYVAGWRHTNPTEIEQGEPPEREPMYETIPFEDWARTECASVGADAVANRIEARTEGDPALGVGITSRYEDLAVSVSQTTTLDRDGDVVSEPSVPFERIVDAAPRAVEATVRLSGQEHTATVPVWVEEQTLRYE